MPRPKDPHAAWREACRRRAAIGFGIALISLVFILETVLADRRLPNAASPWIWAALSLIAAGALASALWWRWRAGRPPR